MQPKDDPTGKWGGQWIQVPPIGFPPKLPKGVDRGTWLLLTQQTQNVISKLRSRKGKDPSVAANLNILSGPSGIGKSCLVLAVALFLRQHDKENILYVADAGNLVKQARSSMTSDISLSRSLVKLLVDLTRQQNPGDFTNKLFPPGTCDDMDFGMWDFASKLNDHNFVVIIDEQGRAFTDLENAKDNFSFGLIYPNFYIDCGNNLRVVLTGSSQSKLD